MRSGSSSSTTRATSSTGPGLAGVDREPEAVLAGPPEEPPVVGDAEGRPTSGPAMSMPTTPRSRQAIAFSTMISLSSYGNARSRQKIRPGLDRVLEGRPVHAADGGRDDVVEVLLAAAVALHRVEAQLHRRDVVLAVGAADDLVDGALDRERRALDQLGPVEELEVAVEAARPRRGDTVIMSRNSQ